MATLGLGGSSSPKTNGKSHEAGYVAGQMRLKLQALLDEKERQLQQSEAFTQRILAQQIELEDRINQIADLDENSDAGNQDEGETEMRTQLDELAQTMHGWATENEELWSGVMSKDAPLGNAGVPHLESDAEPAAHVPSAAQSSRRAKNAAHRANDVEFAFEIGSGLLTEIRRLQSLLAERDKTLQDMKEDKDDMERTLDNLKTALRTQEINADKYKEENWNLEVSLQELRKQHSDTQSSFQRSESEHKRTQNELRTLRETAENYKTDSERLANQLQEVKSKHETNIAQMRKQAATLQREKSELQSNVESLKAEVAKKSRTITRFESPMTPNDAKFLTPARPEYGDEDNEDVFGTVGSTRRRMDSSLVYGQPFDAEIEFSPENSPIKNATAAKSPLIPNQNAAEIESLKQSLSHAHRQIDKLKNSLNRERRVRTEYGQKLQGAGIPVPAVDLEENEEDYEDEPGELPHVTPLRSGRGRGRGGRPMAGGRASKQTSLAVKLALAAKAAQAQQAESPVKRGKELPPADFSLGAADQEEWVDVDDDGYARRRSEDRDSIANASMEEGVSGIGAGRSSDEIGRKHRNQSVASITSIDGMDPAFASLIKSSRDNARTSMDSAPRRSMESASHAKAPRSRAVLAPPQSRPGSVFDAPGTLASELGGLGTADAAVDDDRLREELGLDDEEIEEEFIEEEEPEIIAEEDDDDDEIPPIAAVPEPVKVQTEEAGIQCDLLLPPPEVPRVEQATISVQTDEIFVPPPPSLSSQSIQTDALPEIVVPVVPTPPERVDAGVGTVTVEDYRRNSTAQRVPLEVLGAAGFAAAEARRSMDRVARSAPSAFKDPAIRASTYSRTSTEADTDTEYEDARETLGTATPSMTDRQSIANSESGGESETDSAESIKVSTLQVTRPVMASTSGTQMTMHDVADQIEDASKRDTLRPVNKQAEEVKPKAELKEVSTQTDEWVPPVPTGTALFTVGPQAQQFQFIPGPTSPGLSHVGLATATAAAGAGAGAGAGLKAVPRPDGAQQRSRVGTGASMATITPDTRPRVPSATLSPTLSPRPIDRTKPPTMMLPPPPRLPPPTNSASTSSNSISKPGPPNMGPPPRPTSPPPQELIQRAATPTFSRSSTLAVPAVGTRSVGGSRTSSMGPNTLTQSPTRGGAQSGDESSHDPFIDTRTTPKAGASMSSGRRSLGSRRPSISSSISSEHAIRMMDSAKSTIPMPMVASPRGAENATDPTIIHAITQTMIGEYLYKYTRKPIGKKYTERRHRRYFWIHPYTKTIYWSAVDPGSSNVTESSAKSAYIESVKAVMDPNPMPPGLHQYSVIVSTANREMKFTAPTKERHDIWFNALSYLLSRQNGQPGQSTGDRTPLTSTSANQQRPPLPSEEPRSAGYSPRSPRMGQSAVTVDSLGTPRVARSVSRMSNPYGSVGKRNGTAAAEFMRWTGEPPASPSKAEHTDHSDFHIHDHDDAYDGLENVRACCDGKHDVGSLSHRHHHHQRPHQQQSLQQLFKPNARTTSDAAQERPERPISPSGWSFRSGRSKRGSQEGGLLSWSRRSRQSAAVRP